LLIKKSVNRQSAIVNQQFQRQYPFTLRSFVNRVNWTQWNSIGVMIDGETMARVLRIPVLSEAR
jgi:hypothetical protein